MKDDQEHGARKPYEIGSRLEITASDLNMENSGSKHAVQGICS